MVPEPHHRNTVTEQKGCSLCIVCNIFRLIVLIAVQLDGKFLFRAVEIQDIGTKTVLSEKLQPMKLAIADVTPKGSLGIRLFAAKEAPPLFQNRVVLQEGHNFNIS